MRSVPDYDLSGPDRCGGRNWQPARCPALAAGQGDQLHIAVTWHRAYAVRPPSSAEAMAERLTAYLRRNRHRLRPPGAVPDPDAIGWCDAHWIYLGIEAFRTEVAVGMPTGLAASLLGDAGQLVPGGEQRSFQYRLPRHVYQDRARVYCLDRQRIEGG